MPTPQPSASFVAQPGQELTAHVADLASSVPALRALSMSADALCFGDRRFARPRHEANGMRLVHVANRLLSDVGSDARLVPLSPRAQPSVGQAYALATVSESLDLMHERRLAISDAADLISYAGW